MRCAIVMKSGLVEAFQVVVCRETPAACRASAQVARNGAACQQMVSEFGQCPVVERGDAPVGRHEVAVRAISNRVSR